LEWRQLLIGEGEEANPRWGEGESEMSRRGNSNGKGRKWRWGERASEREKKGIGN
jgi:hypothetical protein